MTLEHLPVGSDSPPETAMILAAGLGTRMRPITDTMPKPLVSVAGRPLIDYALAALKEAGMRRAVVNVHYRAAQMRAHLGGVRGIEIAVSDEESGLLDSGGGVVNALPLLGDAPFVLLNADTFWIDDPSVSTTNLRSLADAFDASRMDFLLLVADLGQATGHEGRGDFVLADDGRLERFRDQAAPPVIYAGAIVCAPQVFDGAPEGPFSLNLLFDRATAAGRLYGQRMHGHWITVGTPEAIGRAEETLAVLARERAGG